MKKPWSLSTTVRNPDRILPFLRVLKEMQGEKFDEVGQIKFQTLLIQNRLYQPMGLSEELLRYYETSGDRMSFSEAEEIFQHMLKRSKELQNDQGLRGRTSVAPLTKMGLAVAKKTTGNVLITDLGNAFLSDRLDIGDIYFRFFIKWQIPNPDSQDYSNDKGYDIKPFIGALHLINAVNKKEIARGKEAKGISKKEFSLFVPTLVNYKDIDDYAIGIIELRDKLSGKNRNEQKAIFDAYEKEFATKFLGTKKTSAVSGLLKNLRDYGDNAIRYFRLTRYIFIRGGGYYIDLESRRSVEIKSLLDFDNAQSKAFATKDEYLDYISDILQPQLPWETKEKYVEIIKNLVQDIKQYESDLQKSDSSIRDYQNFQEPELKSYIEELRILRRTLQEESNHKKSQALEQVESYIKDLENIFDFEDRPILLEKLSSLGLHALNDALRIQPNYPVGDDNEPTFTAPANTPDIECFYGNFNAICEVTMLTGRDQWYNEGQPVMRHLRDFENKYNDKKTYCLFIAPKIHRDTVNTFWTAIKYEYEGKVQKIVPLSITDFVSVLKTLVKIKSEDKFLKHNEISRLYEEIIDSSKLFTDSGEWLKNIPNTISSWQASLV